MIGTETSFNPKTVYFHYQENVYLRIKVSITMGTVLEKATLVIGCWILLSSFRCGTGIVFALAPL